jgi:predicted kinase
MQLIILIGIPGCGKSSFYKEKFFNTHMRISLDMLRTRNRENKLLDLCFATKLQVVIDNTNVKAADREKYILLAREHKYEVIGYYFKADVKACRERNNSREGRAKVPDLGFFSKLKQLQAPSFTEGFDKLYHVELVDGRFDIREWQV